MSKRVDIDALGDSIDEYGPAAFIVTVGEDHRPHLTHVAIDLVEGRLICEVGRTSGANAAAHPVVTLLWPPVETGGYSLIVDGEASVGDAAEGHRVEISPTAAVLHRPAPVGPPPGGAATDGSCDQDCVPLTADDPA